jgi:hypothetical protein
MPTAASAIGNAKMPHRFATMPATNTVETPQARCLVGLARTDITPPIGIYHRMWGAAAHDRAEAIHRPLFASALWLQPISHASGNMRRILIAVDHCILEGDEQTRLRQAVAEATQTPLDQISICLSHTHGSGWTSRARADLPGGELIGPYLDRLAGQLAELAIAARGTLAPATITFGHGRCKLAAHRDYWDEQAGRFVCGFNPDGPADDTLLIGRITDDAGAIRAVLVNYACHPTTLAWDNRAISPDWIGAMRETIETVAGGICVFFQGASGDLGPREGFVGDSAVADRNGRQVGYAALAALEALPPAGTHFAYSGPIISGTWIGTWRHELLDEQALSNESIWRWKRQVVDLIYRPELPSIEETDRERAKFEALEREARATGDPARQRECRAKVEQMTRQLTRLKSLPPGKTYPCQVTAGQLGDSLWVLVPGELYQVFQTTLRQRFAPHPVIVATLTNDWHPGYIPAAASYGYGIYQDEIAAVAPGSLETLLESVSRLFGDLQH